MVRTQLARRLDRLDDVSARMVRGATFTAGSVLVSRLVALATGVIAARVLGAAEFGTFSLCQSTAAVATAVAGMGLPWVTTRMIAAHRVSDPERTRRLWRLLLGLCVGGVLVVLIAGFSTARVLTRLIFGEGSDTTLLIMCLFLFAGSAINNFSQATLMGGEEFAAVARWSIVRNATAAGGVVAGLSVGGVVATVAGYTLGEYAVLGPMFRHGRLLVRGPDTDDHLPIHGPSTRAGAPPRSLPGSGFQMAMAAWGSTLLLHPAFWYAQVLLTRTLGGYSTLGVFALAQRAVQAVVMLPGGVAASSLPILTECWAANRRKDFRRAARRYATGYLAYTVPVSVIAAVTAPFTLRAFGRQYAASWPVFGVLVLAAVPMVVNNLLSSMAVAADRPGLWLFSDVSQAAVLVSAAALLIPVLGGVGASLSFLAASVVTCLALVPVIREPRARP